MIALHKTTTSGPHDVNQTGPEYAGRVMCIGLFGWVLEITIAKKVKGA